MARERLPAGSHFIEHKTEAENVRSRIDFFAPRLLGRHIGESSQGRTRSCEQLLAGGCRHRGNARRTPERPELCQSEIQDAWPSPRVVTQDVRKIDVAVDNAFACAASSGSAIWIPRSRTRSSGSGLPEMKCFSVWPSRYSIAMNCCPFLRRCRGSCRCFG